MHIITTKNKTPLLQRYEERGFIFRKFCSGQNNEKRNRKKMVFFQINIRIGPSKEKGAKPDYGNFVFELRKKDLKHFPVLFKFDDSFKFSGLTILR